MNETVLTHPLGTVRILELGGGRRRIAVQPATPQLYIQASECETGYPTALIDLLLRAKGPLWLCDEILREQNPQSVRSKLERCLYGYADPPEFEGKRILDFGCGCGASLVNLSRMFPDSDVVGVELDADCCAAAQGRLEYYGFSHARCVRSPGAEGLPHGIGTVDYITMNAVYEHLLPSERRSLLPALWRLLNPGGMMFVSETPYRYSFFECHTSGLPFVNFLPFFAAATAIRLLSRRVDRRVSGEKLLRDGVRGASSGELVGILRGAGFSPKLLEPDIRKLHSSLETWHTGLDQLADCYRFRVRGRYRLSKRVLDAVLRRISSHTGIPFVGDLAVALAKR